jgi:cell division protein FtsI/penicillin-binding protein 2
MEKTKKRTKSIFVIFSLWFLFILIYLFYFTVYSRHKYIARSNSLSLKEGTIPASRGSIFDKNGERLAWTQISYNLYFRDKSISDKQKIHFIKEIKKIFPNIKKKTEFYSDNKIIKKNLSPEDLKSIQLLLSNTPELTIEPTLKRVTISIQKVKEYIGTARYINDTWIGLSGIEKEYNSYLNGNAGLYTVMLDKNGKWIKGTGFSKKEMIPGKNLYLKKSIKVITKNAELKNPPLNPLQGGE